MEPFPLTFLVHEFPFEDKQKVAVGVPWIRLSTLLRVGSDQTIREALIDTGAPLSVVPESTWRKVETDVRWLSPTAGSPAPLWLTTLTGVTGGSAVPCRLGIISFTLIKMQPWRALRPVRVLAKFASDGGSLPPHIPLGLGGGVLDSWRLVINRAASQAWLEDQNQ